MPFPQFQTVHPTLLPLVPLVCVNTGEVHYIGIMHIHQNVNSTYK